MNGVMLGGCALRFIPSFYSKLPKCWLKFVSSSIVNPRRIFFDSTRNFSVVSSSAAPIDSNEIADGIRIYEERMRDTVLNEPDILLDPELSDEDRERIKMMKQEYEVWKYADVRMPEYMSNKQWKYMLETKTVRDRVALLTHFAQIIYKRRKNIQQYLERRQANAERRRKYLLEPSNHIIYGQGHNTMFRRFEYHAMKNRLFNIRTQNAVVHNPHIVFDMSFMEEISMRERNLTISQLVFCLEYNRLHREPAALMFTGVNLKSNWLAKLYRVAPHLESEAVLITDKSYLDLYPKEDIIYLSPDGDTMNTFDTNKVHIIGGFVDKPCKARLTLGKAKRENVKALKLPLDNYVKWETGSKYLCLNHVLGMLLDVNLTDDWYEAIQKHVPKRKVVEQPRDVVSHHALRRRNDQQRFSFLESLIKHQQQN